MKKPINITDIFREHTQKAKRYVQLQNEGVSQIEATYRIFGNKIGDEMVRLKQHEIIVEVFNN